MIYTLTFNPSIDYLLEVDELELGKTNRSQSQHLKVGGKGINVSLVLNNLGRPSTLLSFIGGFTGNFVKEELSKYPKITTKLFNASGQTRINVKIKGSIETEVNGIGVKLEKDHLLALESVFETLTENDIVVISGSIAQGMSGKDFLHLLEVLKQRAVQFILDIDHQLLLNALDYQPLLVKPNVDELASLFGKKTLSLKEILIYGQQLAQNAQFVIVSQGKEGALLFHEGSIWQASAPSGDLKNSVGAGDSMVAGFVDATQRKLDVVSILKFSVSCGSATAFSKNFATLEKIQELMEQVKVERIK